MKQVMVFLLAVVLFTLGSCGRAESDSTRADIIPSPQAGYKCFAIKDNDGKTVGGNCLKD